MGLFRRFFDKLSESDEARHSAEIKAWSDKIPGTGRIADAPPRERVRIAARSRDGLDERVRQPDRHRDGPEASETCNPGEAFLGVEPGHRRSREQESPAQQQDRLAKLMKDVDLLVVPSLWPEPFGSVGPGAGGQATSCAAHRTCP